VRGSHFSVFVSCDGLVAVSPDATAQRTSLSKRCKTRQDFSEYCRPASPALYNFDKCLKVDGSLLYFLSQDNELCRADLSKAPFEVRVVAKCDKAVDFGLLHLQGKKLLVAVSKLGKLQLVCEDGSAAQIALPQFALESGDSLVTCCATDRQSLLAVAEWNPKKELAWIKLVTFGEPVWIQPPKPASLQVASISAYSSPS